jgi:hypothetical protein
VAYVPEGAAIALLTAEARKALERMPGVIAVEPYHAGFKLHPSIGRAPLLDPFRAVSAVYDLDVRVFPGEDAGGIAQGVRELGGAVSAVWPDTVRVELDRSKLAELARIEGVWIVFEHLPVVPFGEETTTAIQTGRWNNGATPYHDAGIDGSGGGIGAASPQVLMVLDTGIQLDAADLSHSRVSAGTPGPGHRKVRLYTTTAAFGGSGDLLGCDAGPSGAVTHGHIVAATALGNATRVNVGTYGAAWYATDDDGGSWRLDGVAPGAVLVAYDAQRTPPAGSCADPLANTLVPGDLYSGGATGSLGDAHANQAARVFNLSWGNPQNIYDSHAMDVDQFLRDKGNALVLIAAGNRGVDGDDDGVVDAGSLGAPATAKNALAIGASRAANDKIGGFAEEGRAFFSSTGPAPGNRIAPQLMSPGDEEDDSTNMGLGTEYACATSDNDQLDPVDCSVRSKNEGTSGAAAAASGAALLVRDYFAQGFYPDGTSADPSNAMDQVASVSGALVKAVLVASADFLDGDGLSVPHRFNSEQGYGRIRLDRALPLESWPSSVSGLLVQDSVVSPTVGGIAGLATTIDAVSGGTSTGTFAVCHADDELRVALVWFDVTGQALIDDLDLEIESPSGKRYRGNYFTDDDNRNGVLDANEDCPGIDGSTGTLSSGEWSLPVCQRANATLSPFDRQNPTEAVLLSPDPLGTGEQSQIGLGTWIVRVSSPGGGSTAAQPFAIAIAGGVCQQSWVRLDSTDYACNASASVTVYEVSETGDVTPSAAAVAARTTLQVLDGGVVVDEESGLTFTRNPGALRFLSTPRLLTSGTARDPGNGVLDVRDGDVIRVLYEDTTGLRSSQARVSCTPSLDAGGVTIEQFGQDASFRLHGGCERSARGLFEFGFPDRYLDAGELLTLEIAFAAYERTGLEGAEIDLRCVIPDGDSPSACIPPGGSCPDPYRANNPSCDQRPSGNAGDLQYMTIFDTPRVAGFIPPDSALALSFPIEMAPSIPGTPEVELVLSMRGDTSGKSSPGLVISRQRLDADELSKFYSTDFPTGGVQSFDVSQSRAGDEILQNPVTNINDPTQDYRFETLTWSDLTAGGTKNMALLSPWDFDKNDGGFRSGILATTTYSTITNVISQWGEDLNFNNVLDKSCTNDRSRSCVLDTDCVSSTCTSHEDRDPLNGSLDRSWNIRGGCGWQTKPPGVCSNDNTRACSSGADCTGAGTCTMPSPGGGIWHTGRIGATPGTCAEQCQLFETVAGSEGVRAWREALVTPVVQKVNGDDHEIEIVQWAWNQALELPDNNVALAWELDTNAATTEPVDLYGDSVVLNALFGPFGPIYRWGNPRLTNGFSMFAPLTANMQQSFNGAVGNNRQGKNACFFEGGAILAGAGGPCPGCPFVPGELSFAGPLDDDVNNDGDGFVDEYVTANGPTRNMDLRAVNGPDMRFDKLEDLYGDTGKTFQAALSLWNFEKTPAEPAAQPSYGIGVDDMVLEWREYTLVDDAASCASGQCAVIDLQASALFENSAALTITVLEKTPDPANDCNLDGAPDGTVDCNGNGLRDIVVRVTSGGEPDGEIVWLDSTAVAHVFRGELPLSTTSGGPGILHLGQFAGGPELVTASYEDRNDGTGAPCRNDLIPGNQGRIRTSLSIPIATGRITLVSTELEDNGDHDAFADTNETAEVRMLVHNRGQSDLTSVTAYVETSDAKIDCVLRSAIWIGDVPAQSDVLSDESFVIRVANVDRAAAGLTDLQPFAATFQVRFAADQFQVDETPQLFTLDLDLDPVGGSGPTTFFEGFESGTFGAFEPHNMDQNLFGSLAASNGYRCQYHDPDVCHSASCQQITDCYLGANQAHADAFFWQINTPASSNHGKAFSGNNSLYMGIFGAAPDFMTTPVSVLEAVRTSSPINLAAGDPAPELSYKHQVDLLDSKNVNSPPGQAPSRYVAMLQLADQTGNPVGNWIKLQPYLNVYDQTAVDNYFNCTFDPIDDGNDEDDYFDPTDPDRSHGPSSTCNPERNFTYIGETSLPYDPQRVGNASDGPGLEGSLGIGTWIETRFSLDRFRGRRARLRFLNTDLKVNNTLTTWASVFTTLNPGPGDDGIWIDDVQVTNTLAQPVTMTRDTKPNLGLPGCGNTCNVVTAALAVEPPGILAAPGQVVELDAGASDADRCLGGVLLYRFSIDGNGDGLGGSAQDTQLSGWSEATSVVHAPVATTSYVVDVRCSSDPACSDSVARTVVVECPSSGNLSFPEVLAPNRTTLTWGASRLYDFAKGLLANLSSYTTTATGQGAGPASSFDIAGDIPPAGAGFWYLFRDTGPLGQGATGYCNAPGITWGSAQRDAALP